jgi:hypothetical protein
MVLVAERPEPLAAHEHGGSSTSGSGSRDLGPAGRPEAGQKAATCSQMSMEVSVGTMHLPARWSVKPFDMDFTGLQPSRTSLNW